MAVVVVTVATLSAVFWRAHGSSDTDDFRAPWVRQAEVRGVVAGYVASQSDYPPGAMLLLDAGPMRHAPAPVRVWTETWLAWLVTVALVAGVTREPVIALVTALAFALSALGLVELAARPIGQTIGQIGRRHQRNHAIL